MEWGDKFMFILIVIEKCQHNFFFLLEEGTLFSNLNKGTCALCSRWNLFDILQEEDKGGFNLEELSLKLNVSQVCKGSMEERKTTGSKLM
jgi:hypothetical protein